MERIINRERNMDIEKTKLSSALSLEYQRYFFKSTFQNIGSLITYSILLKKFLISDR